MSRPTLAACAFGALALSLLAAASSHAQQIHKWTDANGNTHYSERKPDAASKTQPVNIDLPPVVPPPSTAPKNDMKAPKATPPVAPKPAAKPAPNWHANPDGSEMAAETSRCTLAREVLKGTVRHGNGKPLDGYDREVAQNDVKSACPSR